MRRGWFGWFGLKTRKATIWDAVASTATKTPLTGLPLETLKSLSPAAMQGLPDVLPDALPDVLPDVLPLCTGSADACNATLSQNTSFAACLVRIVFVSYTKKSRNLGNIAISGRDSCAT